MEKSKKQYFNEINIMRGMAVLCVVIGHSFNPTKTPTILGFIKSFVYCFHMPAFFFISGFLEGEKRRSISEKKQAIVKKAKRLMVPYFFLTVVTAVLKLLFGAFARNPLNYSTLAVDVLIGRNNPNGGLWFLYALFVISIFGILFDTINRTTLTGTMFVLYMLNTIVFKQSGYVVGFFLSYAFLMISVVFGGMCGLLGGMFAAVKQSRINAMSSFSGACINIMLNIPLTFFFNALGASFATLMSYFTVWLIRLYKSYKLFEFTVEIKKDALNYFVLLLQAVVQIAGLSLLRETFIEIILFVLVLYFSRNNFMLLLNKLLKR